MNIGDASAFSARIGRIPYGTRIRIPRREWIDIIPRVDPIRQIMLATSGHRPETEREPIDWIRFWLNGTSDDDFMVVKHDPYHVSEDPSNGDLIISLPAELCPKCRGRGVYDVIPPIHIIGFFGDGGIPDTSSYTVRQLKCICENMTDISSVSETTKAAGVCGGGAGC